VNDSKHDMTDSRVGDYFHKAASVWDTFYDGKRRPFMQWVDRNFRSDVFERYRLTFEEMGDCGGKTLLDVGCGSGPYCVEAARRGCTRAVGFDMAPGMIELASQRANHMGVAGACEFRVGTFPKDAPDGVFDYAIAMGVMDYVDPPVEFVRGLRKCAKTAMVSVPTPHWFRTPVRKIRYKLKKCPVFFYTRQQVEDMFRQAGFEDIRILKIPGAGMDFFVVAR
jgi:2-polyprenyl-3-methyl-5-hydroxy-6-metoxy-1,4-benzoquinol methylase